MNRKECRDTRREIDQSELHQALSDRALRHVQSCALCREFRAERARLRDLVASLEPVVAPADFDVRLRARLAAQRHSNRQWFFSGFAVSVPATVAAALIVMLVGSMVWMTQRNRTKAPAIALAPPKQLNTAPRDNSSVAINQSSSPVANAAITSATNSGANDLARNRNVSLNRRAARPAFAKGSGGQSRDFSELPAQSIRGIDNAGEVSLTAPVKPMVVSMQDDRGATRKISLPPVSFGSQRLVDNRMPVSATGSRVW